jgi:hypothetical protein
MTLQEAVYWVAVLPHGISAPWEQALEQASAEIGIPAETIEQCYEQWTSQGKWYRRQGRLSRYELSRVLARGKPVYTLTVPDDIAERMIQYGDTQAARVDADYEALKSAQVTGLQAGWHPTRICRLKA